MIWIVIVILVLGYLYYKNSDKTTREEINKKTVEDIIYERALLIMNSQSNSEELIGQLNYIIFEHCLKKSNKNISIKEVSNPVKVFENPSLLKYTAIFSAIKSTTTTLFNMTSSSTKDKEKVIKDTLNPMIDFTIEEINKF